MRLTEDKKFKTIEEEKEKWHFYLYPNI